MKERMQKISTKSDSWPQNDRTESDSYAGVQTFIGITENHLTEVQFSKEDLLERILSPSNMNLAYKRVLSNGGRGGIDKLETEDLLPYLLLHKDALESSLLAGHYCPNPVRRVAIPKRRWQVSSFRDTYGNRSPDSTIDFLGIIPYL
jgi:hypothetical protein